MSIGIEILDALTQSQALGESACCDSVAEPGGHFGSLAFASPP